MNERETPATENWLDQRIGERIRKKSKMTTTGHAFKPLQWVKEGDCIRTTSHCSSAQGYPLIYRNGKRSTIARLILTRRHGALRRDQVSRHTCDNTWCISPAHIIIGTQSDNIRDAVSRGRMSGPTRLTTSEIQQIRTSQGSQSQIARQFSVDQSYVSYLKNNKRRKNT